MSEPHNTTRTYWLVFLALIVLLIVTVAVAFVSLGPLNVAVALLIATAKAALVALYFMHVRESSRLTWVFAAGGFVWLILLLVLTASDYTTRQADEAEPTLSVRDGTVMTANEN